MTEYGCNACEYKRTCPNAHRPDAEEICAIYPWQVLYNAKENCNHEINPVLAGGVKCSKCGGWFCY